MIRKLMASSAIAALTAAGALSFAYAQIEQPAGAEPPAAMEQPAAGADQGAAPAAAPAPAPPPPAADGATTTVTPEATTEQPADAATTTTIAPEATAEQDATADAPPANETLTPEEPTIASAFMGQAVYSSQEPESDNIGEVNDLIIGDEGRITHAVVGVGGFLGIGEKNVAVPFDQLQVVEDDDGDIRLIYAATREQLEAAEAFDRTAYDPEARAAEEQAATSGGTDATGAGGVTPGLAPTPTEQTAPGADAGSTDQDNAADDVTAESADQTNAAETITDATVVEQQPAQTESTAAPAETSTVATTAGAAAGAAAGAMGGFMSFSADQVRASSMIGQEIYGSDTESIGEVSDLILQEDGKTRAALIDVGGFLGIGEKRVAIPFDQIEMVQPTEMDVAAQTAPAITTDPAAPAVTTDPAGTAGVSAPATATDPANQTDTTAVADPATPAVVADGEPRLTVAMTREQLEQLPEWEEPATRAAEQTAATDPNMTAGTAPAAGTDPNAAITTDGNIAAGTDGQMAEGTVAQDQFRPMTEELSAGRLMGSAVYGQNDDNLGEVGDVVFDMQGAIQAVVVDVGGFLGIGEKRVAIQYDALKVQTNETGDVRLVVNATQEQLESAPSYDESAGTSEGGAQPTTVQ